LIDIQRGIDLFNDADFFSAHDYFEDLWMDCEQKNRLFFQGMVQISVGSYHLICANYKGALSQFNKGTEKLKNYVPYYLGVNLDKLLREVKLLSFLLEDNSPKTTQIEIEKLPKIEYKKIA
jgi:predicted metal-dependent hydrolase